MNLDQARFEFCIPSEQAAKQLGSDLDSFDRLANEGKLRAAGMTDGRFGIRQISVDHLLPKQALPEDQLNTGLKGVPIRIKKAERDDKLNPSSLRLWTRREKIHPSEKDGITNYFKGLVIQTKFGLTAIKTIGWKISW